jgi:hypothetical protein
MASSRVTEKVLPHALLGMTVGLRPSGRRQLSVAGARFHREHDGEYLASLVCNGARIWTVHRTFVNGTGLSRRGDTWWTSHGPCERRFTDSIYGTSIPPGGRLSVCRVVLRHRRFNSVPGHHIYQ